MTLSDEVRRGIRDIPGESGWWHIGGEEAAVEVAENLANLGVDDEAIIESLSAMYGAVAGEFGG